MAEQLETAEQQEQDTEIQSVVAEITGTLQAAFDILIERRDTAYAAAIAPLDAEIKALGKEHGAIREAAQGLAELLPAKARVAQAEHDRLLLAGDRQEAAKRLAEQKEAEHAAEAMRARQEQITSRIQTIEGEKQSAARRIFASWYKDCERVVRPVERGLFVVILDGLQKSFFDFQTLTNTGGDGVMNTLFNQGHIAGLTAAERSQEWRSAVQWYGVRRR
jgi:hypothetical protein